MSMFSKPLLTLKVACVSLSLCALPASACDNGTARMSGAKNYPPISWLYEKQLIGTSVDLAKETLKELGVEGVTDMGGPWKRVLKRAKQGEIDILLGVRKTPEREEYLHFISPPIAPSVQSVFVLKDSKQPFKNWDDLKNKSGAKTLGSSFGNEFDSYAKEHLYIQETRLMEHIFKKMEHRRIDYFIGPLVPVLLELSKHQKQGLIVNQSENLTVINEYIAISKKSSCAKHVDYFKSRMDDYVNGEKMTSILERNFGLWFDQNDIVDPPF